MMELMSRLFSRGDPALSDATPRDSAAMAALHGASFRRGWSDGEIERLLLERNTVAQRAMVGRGLARALLNLHLGRLAGLRVRSVFLEVDEDNVPARRLYERAGFREVGRRAGYYPQGSGAAATALVLRRDLV